MLTIEAHLQEKDKKDKSVAWHLVTSFMGDEFQLPARFKVTEQWKDKEHSNFRLARNKKKYMSSHQKKPNSVTFLNLITLCIVVDAHVFYFIDT